jgi:hypothetical protein
MAEESAGNEHLDGVDPDPDDTSFLFERIDALKVLRADTPEEKDRLLEQLAGRGKVEQDIVRELAKPLPLWKPAQFERSHRLMMRSLEVLDRNGSRKVKVRRLGPLTPIAQFLVQQVTRWIVKSHQNTLMTRVRKLYEQREASCAWGSPEHHMLRRARINAVQVESGLKGTALGLPTFLLGGAFIGTVLSGLGGATSAALSNRLGVILFAAVLLGLLFSLSWAAIVSAAVARRRIRLCVDQPSKALWETIGAAGSPPRDQSYNFAVYAIVLAVLAVIVVPSAILLLFRAA